MSRALALLLVLSGGTARGQAVEVRSARLLLPSGDEQAVDGGVWIPAPEFTAYVRACVACQREAAKPTPSPTAGGYAIAFGLGALVGVVGIVVAFFALRAP